MRSIEYHNGSKIIQSLRSIQVGGRGQIAVVEDTPVGSDAIRQWNILHSSFKRFVLNSKAAITPEQHSDVNALPIQKLLEKVNA